MNRSASAILFLVAIGAASASVSINGTEASIGSGEGWTREGTRIRLHGQGPFVVSGTGTAEEGVLCAEADCSVVVSNLALSAAETGLRARADGLVLADSVAEAPDGSAVAAFADGLYFAPSGKATGSLSPDDPATAFGYAFSPGDAWTRSNVSWTPDPTNFAAVVRAGDRFVAATFRGGLLVSEDGASWRAAAVEGNPLNLRAVARSGADGTLVAASTRGLWTSRDDGLTWAPATNLYANAVVWSEGLFVACGDLRGAGAEGVYWSADGLSWRARGFFDLPQYLDFVIAAGSGRFLAGNAGGYRTLRFANGEIVSTSSRTASGTKFAVASGNGRIVACSLANTGLRWADWSDDGLSWTRSSNKQDGTFLSIVWRNGRFLAEGVDPDWAYAGLWTSEDGKEWTSVPDEYEVGLPALDCGGHAVRLVVSGTGNSLEGGLYAPAVRVASGGSLDLSSQDAAPASLSARGGRLAAAVGGGLGESSGAFVQRGATLLAAGGSGAPDIGFGAGGSVAEGATILGGSLFPAGGGIVPAPSNDVEAVRCVVVDGLAPGEAVELANLPGAYGTDGVVADENGRVWLWLPASASSFRFLAGGALRRVAAGGGASLAEALPNPKVRAASFGTASDGSMEVTMRVSSPVEAAALAPAFSSDLSALLSGGGEPLAPTRVDQVSPDEYELSFRLPDDGDSGYLVIRAR